MYQLLLGYFRSTKISFGGIPNSSIMDHGPFLLRNGFAYVDNVIQNNHTAAPVKVAAPELSGTFRTLPPEPTPARAGTLQNLPQTSRTFRNLPNPASGTYTSTHRNPPGLPEPLSGTCSCDPHQHTPELIWAEDPISLRCWGNTSGYFYSKTSAVQWPVSVWQGLSDLLLTEHHLADTFR